MTIGEDRPDPSDFPRVKPPHACWRNGGVECAACEIEEQEAEAHLAAAPDTYGVGVAGAT